MLCAPFLKKERYKSDSQFQGSSFPIWSWVFYNNQVRHFERRLFDSSSPITRIDIGNVSREELQDTYIDAGTPVIVTGLTVEKWTWDVFREAYSGATVEATIAPTGLAVFRNSPDDDFYLPRKDPARSISEGHAYSRILRSDEAFDRVLERSRHAPIIQDEEKIYIYGNRIPPTFKSEVDVPNSLFEGDPDLEAWFSQAGCVTTLHYDGCSGSLWQILGKKRVVMFPADAYFPEFPPSDHRARQSTIVDLRNATGANLELLQSYPCWEEVLHPGELLFIPPFVWHYVETLTPSTSFTLRTAEEADGRAMKYLADLFGTGGIFSKLSPTARKAVATKFRAQLDSLDQVDLGTSVVAVECQLIENIDSIEVRFEEVSLTFEDERWFPFARLLGAMEPFVPREYVGDAEGKYRADELGERILTLTSTGVLVPA